MPCLCNIGQRCATCPEKGEPDAEIPCAAWCPEHAALPLDARIAIWQAAVLAREERERNAE